jgi:Uma2 family endonuclease
MALVIDESWLPATLTVPPMDDDQFAAFCAEHPDLFFETTAEGELIVMPPTYTLTGIRNSEILEQLVAWARMNNEGLVTDAAAGFVLPSGARRSPDAAWTRKVRVRQLDKTELEGFWHLCPDFVIERRSTTDSLPVLRAKMREWIENGAQLAWLIDPERRAVEVFRANCDPETIEKAEAIVGEGPVDGFVLSLAEVWDPLA